MNRILCLTALVVTMAFPVYAGHGTIKETDTAIIVEYSGDDDDKQAAKVLKEEQQKEEAQQQKAAEVTKRENEHRAEKNSRALERRKDEE
jgi:hypothetical protein